MSGRGTNNYPRELGLLRAVVREIRLIPHQTGPLRQDSVLRNGLARSRLGPLGVIGIRPPAETPFRELSKALFRADAVTSRGTPLKEFQSELFGTLLELNYGRDESTLTQGDVAALADRMLAWFRERSASRLVFVVCCLSRWCSPDFDIGPVHFSHYENLRNHRSELEARTDLTSDEFEYLFATMQDEAAHWLAAIELDGFDAYRGFEVANLAVDLSIVAIQLAAPYFDTKNMSRLHSRRGTGQVHTLAYSAGAFVSGHHNVEPGLSIGEGSLVGRIINASPVIISVVGNLIHSFASGNYRRRLLEQSWCDAAYWLHQGLAEPLDTIAVTKLETAIEVLMRAESSQGSVKRVLEALEIFFGLKPTDHINAHSSVTAKSFAKSIVSGRSRILHGTSPTLFENVSDLRSTLEYFAVTLVRAYAVEFEQYIADPNSPDSLESFLKWIKCARQARAVQQNSNS